MRISFLCSDEQHPVNAHLTKWMDEQKVAHQIELVQKKEQLSGGDLLFLISCNEIVEVKDRSAYYSTLVIHASDLPHGRGWSPHIWQLLQGSNEITLSLIEAEDKVDSGKIWKKFTFPIPPNALWDEINQYLFAKEIELIKFAIENMGKICPVEQDRLIPPTYYPRRSPADSELDPSQSLSDLFNQIRVCDPNRFPAFFRLHGKKYKLILEKIND